LCSQRLDLLGELVDTAQRRLDILAPAADSSARPTPVRPASVNNAVIGGQP